MLSDVDDAVGKQAADDVTAAGHRASYLHLDVASETEWQDAVTATVAGFGGLDILVNNAGVHGEHTSVEDTHLTTWERSIAILQTGVFLGTKAAAPALRRSQHAVVVNISSVFGVSGGFGTSPAYHAAKGAVRTLTKTAALHWAQEGIRVNSIHPGFIDTGLLDPELAKGQPRALRMRELMLDATPMRRFGSPDDVAAGVAYLASDDAGFVTGSELYIDGGYTAR